MFVEVVSSVSITCFQSISSTALCIDVQYLLTKCGLSSGSDGQCGPSDGPQASVVGVNLFSRRMSFDESLCPLLLDAIDCSLRLIICSVMIAERHFRPRPLPAIRQRVRSD